MAHIIPSDWQQLDALHELEKETIEWLEEALPDSLTVFAGLRWAASLGGANAHFGEIDLAIVAPSGKLLVIEQKNGGLSVEDGHLVKRYGGQAKDVHSQIRRSIDALKSQWNDQGNPGPLFVDYLVYLPDYRVHDLSAVDIQSERVIDRHTKAELAERIQTLLAGRKDEEQHQRLLQFLEGTLGVVLDIDISSLRINQRYQHHGEQLYRVIRDMQFDPWRLRVTGPAGCGKTLLGQAMFRAAKKQKQRAAYLCYNRPLADGLARSLRALGSVMTIDHLTASLPLDDDFDPSDGHDGFEERRQALLQRPAPSNWQFDLLVVDEGQDFSASQLALAEHLLAPGGRMLWLDDPRQQLYRRTDEGEFAATVTLPLRDNYRNSRTITRTVNTLLKPEPEDIPASAIEGDAVDFRIANGDDLATQLVDCVRELLDQGYPLADIVVLSYHGHQSSQLLKNERLGPWPTRRFTGEYDANGNQCYTPGDLRLESLHRFKGLQAEAVILAELDFEKLDEQARQRLYVGMTRARQKLILLLHPEAEAAIRQALG